MIAKQYRENKDNLRDQLLRESYRLSKLIDTNWRVDQILASSQTTQDSTKSAALGAAEKTVHLQLLVDHKPNVNEESLKDIQELAFEISPANLDLLILELSQAQEMMNNLDTSST
jgi:hypothetical protein